VGLKALIKRALTRVSKGRVPDIVDQSQGLCEIDIEAQRGRYLAGDLRYFDRVGKPTAEMVGSTTGEDLCLAGQAPKGPGLNHSVTVPCKGQTFVTGRCRKLSSSKGALSFAKNAIAV
jgi:hypothetical protein